MSNEKGISAKDASNTDLKSELTMDNNKLYQNKLQSNSRRELLEQTKLSRLPQRQPFSLPDLSSPNAPTVVAVCAGCSARLDRDDNFQQSIHGCRKCIGIYARIDAALEESAKRKKKELLEKFTGGAK